MAASQPKPKGFDSCFDTENPAYGDGKQSRIAREPLKSSCFHTEKPALMQDLVEGGGQIATSCFHTENL